MSAGPGLDPASKKNPRCEPASRTLGTTFQRSIRSLDDTNKGYSQQQCLKSRFAPRFSRGSAKTRGTTPFFVQFSHAAHPPRFATMAYPNPYPNVKMVHQMSLDNDAKRGNEITNAWNRALETNGPPIQLCTELLAVLDTFDIKNSTQPPFNSFYWDTLMDLLAARLLAAPILINSSIVVRLIIGFRLLRYGSLLVTHATASICFVCCPLCSRATSFPLDRTATHPTSLSTWHPSASKLRDETFKLGVTWLETRANSNACFEDCREQLLCRHVSSGLFNALNGLHRFSIIPDLAAVAGLHLLKGISGICLLEPIHDEVDPYKSFFDSNNSLMASAIAFSLPDSPHFKVLPKFSEAVCSSETLRHLLSLRRESPERLLCSLFRNILNAPQNGYVRRFLSFLTK